MVAHPLISIIMPCYNAERHIASSISSALDQSYQDIELIVVNDGSTDNSLDIIESIEDPRLTIINQPNSGVCRARNRGLKETRGEFITFLDADDTWDPRCLEKLFTALNEQPTAVLAYCGWQNVGQPGARGQPFIPPDYETPDKMKTLFAGCRWPIHATLSRRTPLLDTGGFDVRLKNAEDYALWLELAHRGPIVLVPEVLAYYHFHSDLQASNNLARAALHLLSAQLDYLQRHPEFSEQLGHSEARRIIYGQLLKRGFESYWSRHLTDARIIFHTVMKAGYGSLKDWRYMLPSLLPLPVHKSLIRLLEKPGPTTARPDN